MLIESLQCVFKVERPCWVDEGWTNDGSSERKGKEQKVPLVVYHLASKCPWSRRLVAGSTCSGHEGRCNGGKSKISTVRATLLVATGCALALTLLLLEQIKCNMAENASCSLSMSCSHATSNGGSSGSSVTACAVGGSLGTGSHARGTDSYCTASSSSALGVSHSSDRPFDHSHAAISYHRPFLRSAIARSLYDRMMREEQLRKLDRSKWYIVNMDVLKQESAEDLIPKFVQFSCDEDTDKFIEMCYQKSDWFITHLYHSVARSVLGLFMTSTSINGLLGRGSMFVFSDDQFKKLYFDPEALEANNTGSNGKSLLDIGAGDGKVTGVMARYFDEVYVTEISPVMRKILSKKGYKVLDVDSWHKEDITYDMISCLNILDRCDRPLTLLDQLLTKLKPDGYILIALVFPISQYVEASETGDHKPRESLGVTGAKLEEQLVSFYNKVLLPRSLEVVRWTRLPYLCEGDIDLSFYWLHDVVMLLRVVR